MRAEELRIGNLIQAYLEPQISEWVEIEVYPDVLGRIQTYPDRHGYKPIPLTEEWLLKFGFEKGNYKELNEKHFVKKTNTIKVIISGIGFWDVYTDYNPYQITFSNGLNIITDNKGINHVHQLQNLYFALTGEELKLTK